MMANRTIVTVSDAECKELLATASWTLCLKLPFLGHVVTAFDRVIDPSIATAAVGAGHDGHPTLFVNPQFFGAKLKRDDHRVAVLEHEVLHVVFGHLQTRHTVMTNERLRNIAMDLVVNQFVSHPLPRGAVTLGLFGFQPNLSAEEYYKLLKALPGDAFEKVKGDPSLGHGRWKDTGADRFDEIVDRALRRAQLDGSFNALGKSLRETLIMGRFAPSAATGWRRALRIFNARAQRNAARATNNRESRRYGSFVNDWRGPIVPGLRRTGRPTLAVAIDTSGSISPETVNRFYRELACIVRTGASVHVIECDLAVQRDYPWTGETPKRYAGGGGTSFDPVFRWLDKEGRRLNIAGCVYLTDGQAQRPIVRPPCPVLWAITPDGTPVNTDFGPAVMLPA